MTTYEDWIEQFQDTDIDRIIQRIENNQTFEYSVSDCKKLAQAYRNLKIQHVLLRADCENLKYINKEVRRKLIELI